MTDDEREIMADLQARLQQWVMLAFEAHCEMATLKMKLQSEHPRKRNNLDAHFPHVEEIRKQIFDNANGACAYCEQALSFHLTKEHERWSTHGFVVDHVVPIACGGPNHIKNFAASCPSCNAAKADKHPLEFIKSMARRKNLAERSLAMTGERE